MPEKKFIRSLAKALADENAYIRKLTLAKRLTAAFSLIVLFAVLFLLLKQGNALGLWLALTSFFAGSFLALSAHFNSSLRLWPILRRFLNTQAIQEAASHETT